MGLTIYQIRHKITKALKERPMKAWEIATGTGIHIVTVKKHLEYLRDIYIVEEREFELCGGEIVKKLWVYLPKKEQKEKKRIKEALEER